MIDTHSHLYLEDFDPDRAEAVARAKGAGVKHLILPNVDAETVEQMKRMHEAYPEYTDMAMGLHPTSVTKDNEEFLQYVEAEIATGKYVAVGEVGLDLYWDREYENEQKEVFARQIAMAAKYGLPVIVHTRNAMPQLTELLGDYRGELPTMVFHSFTGSADDARQLLALEKNGNKFYFGLNGIVTFKNSKPEEMLKCLGLGRILLETDCPYLAPVPYRGKRNESAYVVKVCEKLANIFGTTVQEMDRITTENARKAYPKINGRTGF